MPAPREGKPKQVFMHTQHIIYFIKMGNLYDWVDLFKIKFWAFETPRLELRFAKYSRFTFAKLLGHFLKKLNGQIGRASCRERVSSPV